MYSAHLQFTGIIVLCILVFDFFSKIDSHITNEMVYLLYFDYVG